MEEKKSVVQFRIEVGEQYVCIKEHPYLELGRIYTATEKDSIGGVGFRFSADQYFVPLKKEGNASDLEDIILSIHRYSTDSASELIYLFRDRIVSIVRAMLLKELRQEREKGYVDPVSYEKGFIDGEKGEWGASVGTPLNKSNKCPAEQTR